jgi:hypothetical protein
MTQPAAFSDEAQKRASALRGCYYEAAGHKFVNGWKVISDAERATWLAVERRARELLGGGREAVPADVDDLLNQMDTIWHTTPGDWRSCLRAIATDIIQRYGSPPPSPDPTLAHDAERLGRVLLAHCNIMEYPDQAINLGQHVLNLQRGLREENARLRGALEKSQVDVAKAESEEGRAIAVIRSMFSECLGKGDDPLAIRLFELAHHFLAPAKADAFSTTPPPPAEAPGCEARPKTNDDRIVVALEKIADAVAGYGDVRGMRDILLMMSDR